MTNEQEPNPDRDRFIRFVIRSTQVATAQIAAEDPYAALADESRLRALNAFDYAQRVPEAWPQAYELLMTLAPKMEMGGHRGPWIEYLERGVACSQQQQDRAAEGELSLQIGYLYMLTSRCAEADTWLWRSQYCFCEINNKQGEGRALNRLAMVAVRTEKLSEAEKLANQAWHLLCADHTDLANTYFVLGEVAKEQRLWQEAEQHHRDSLKYWGKQDDIRRVAWGLRNLGPILRWQKKYDDAIDCYKRALQIFEKINDPINQAVTRMNLGNVYLQTGKFNEALTLYKQAEPIFRASSDILNLGKVVLNIGLAYEHLENFDLAESAYIQSIEIWTHLNVISWLCNTMDCLGEIYRKQNQFYRAIQVYSIALEKIEQVQDESTYRYYFEMLERHRVKAKMGDAS